MISNWQDGIFIIFALSVFNLAIMLLLKRTLGQVDVREAALEKAAPASSAETAGTGGTDPETSYSRVAGLVGMVVMACFLWALGNLTIYLGLTGKAEQLKSIISETGSLFLAGASLFAPYAFNQLRVAFK